FVHSTTYETAFGEGARRPVGRHDVEAALEQNLTQFDRRGLVPIADADERRSTPWEHHPRCELRLRVCFAERLARSHHLPRRLHLRAEYRIGLGKLHEGEYGFFDGKVAAL